MIQAAQFTTTKPHYQTEDETGGIWSLPVGGEAFRQGLAMLVLRVFLQAGTGSRRVRQDYPIANLRRSTGGK